MTYSLKENLKRAINLQNYLWSINLKNYFKSYNLWSGL